MIDIKHLTRELERGFKEEIILIETTAEKILEVNLAIVKWLSKKKYAQIILSASRPCQNLLDIYSKNSIDISKIVLLCTLCPETGKNKSKSGKVIHISSSSSLTEMSLALGKCMASIKENKFIFIDSISTLLIHNEPNTLAKFTHSILTKMRINNVFGLLISLEADTNTEFKAEIAQLCDKVIKIR